MSSVITISQPPSVPGDGRNEAPTEMTFAPVESETEADIETLNEESKDGSSTGSSNNNNIVESPTPHSPLTGSHTPEPTDSEIKKHARAASLAKLQSPTPPSHRNNPRKDIGKRKLRSGPDAVIVLKEERVSCLSSHCNF